MTYEIINIKGEINKKKGERININGTTWKEG